MAVRFTQHFEDGWNYQTIVLLALLWFGLSPVLSCVIAARVFEERTRGETTGRSALYGLATGVSMGIISVLITLSPRRRWPPLSECSRFAPTTRRIGRDRRGPPLPQQEPGQHRSLLAVCAGWLDPLRCGRGRFSSAMSFATRETAGLYEPSGFFWASHNGPARQPRRESLLIRGLPVWDGRVKTAKPDPRASKPNLTRERVLWKLMLKSGREVVIPAHALRKTHLLKGERFMIESSKVPIRGVTETGWHEDGHRVILIGITTNPMREDRDGQEQHGASFWNYYASAAWTAMWTFCGKPCKYW